MVTSFVDDNFRYVRAFIKRDYNELAQEVIGKKDDYTFYIEKGDTLVGYTIARNNPVSELYGFEVHVVRFHFANFDTLHTEEQSELCNELISHLDNDMTMQKAYFNLRIPTQMVDLIKACNKILRNPIICGGTVEEFIVSKRVDDNLTEGLNVFTASPSYLEGHKEKCMSMTYDSFKSYQGQYHLSPVTAADAGKIYERWIESSIGNNSDNKVIVAEYNNELVGFVTISEDDYSVDGILSAVDINKRSNGAYKAMISHIINYANDNGKAFVTSTQFDNFIVQGTWNSLGLKPFYSIYNIHYDYR